MHHTSRQALPSSLLAKSSYEDSKPVELLDSDDENELIHKKQRNI
jgi:hypothetical protein